MSRKQIFFFAALAVGVVLLAAVLLIKSKPAARIIPNPNGYDDFLQAGKAPIVYDSDLSLLELKGYVKTNQISLDLIRAGLKKDCEVPFDPSPSGFSSHVTDVMAIKANAHLLFAEGRLAERENRFEDASKIYLELIEYGCVSGKGGFYIDKMVSRACELMGISAMTNVVVKTLLRNWKN